MDLWKLDERLSKIEERLDKIEFYIDDKKVYENKCIIPHHITEWLDDKLRNSGCPDTFKETLHYEYRPGMLNFSVCGRDVTTEQRKNYFDWDNKHLLTSICS